MEEYEAKIKAKMLDALKRKAAAIGFQLSPIAHTNKGFDRGRHRPCDRPTATHNAEETESTCIRSKSWGSGGKFALRWRLKPPNEPIKRCHAAVQMVKFHGELANALGLDPGDFRDPYSRPEEAVRHLTAAVAIRPRRAGAHHNLGLTLRAQGSLEEAVVEFREAIRLKPDDARAHADLGLALQTQRKREDALAEFRRAAELAPAGSPVAHVMPGRIRQVEQQIALAGRLPAFLKGNDPPRDAAEALTFAQLCQDEGLNAGAARLFAETFAADPKLAEDLEVAHRHSAACCAPRPAVAKAKTIPPPTR